ncbi:hypothetical protein Fmac_025797 [Flemingia macrophylla]|uniref:Uncharacterized protein n=1 Tax=Flemingia macrophylla TaxID=520843 RepID=A0ABD1LD13_9FABA
MSDGKSQLASSDFAFIDLHSYFMSDFTFQFSFSALGVLMFLTSVVYHSFVFPRDSPLCYPVLRSRSLFHLNSPNTTSSLLPVLSATRNLSFEVLCWSLSANAAESDLTTKHNLKKRRNRVSKKKKKLLISSNPSIRIRRRSMTEEHATDSSLTLTIIAPARDRHVRGGSKKEVCGSCCTGGRGEPPMIVRDGIEAEVEFSPHKILSKLQNDSHDSVGNVFLDVYPTLSTTSSPPLPTSTSPSSTSASVRSPSPPPPPSSPPSPPPSPSSSQFRDPPPLPTLFGPLLQFLHDTNSSFFINLYRPSPEIPLGITLFQDHPSTSAKTSPLASGTTTSSTSWSTPSSPPLSSPATRPFPWW